MLHKKTGEKEKNVAFFRLFFWIIMTTIYILNNRIRFKYFTREIACVIILTS